MGAKKIVERRRESDLYQEIVSIHKELKHLAPPQNQVKTIHLVITVALFVSGAVAAYFDGISKAKEHADIVVRPIVQKIDHIQGDIYEMGKKIERMSVLLEQAEGGKLAHSDHRETLQSIRISMPKSATLPGERNESISSRVSGRDQRPLRISSAGDIRLPKPSL